MSKKSERMPPAVKPLGDPPPIPAERPTVDPKRTYESATGYDYEVERLTKDKRPTCPKCRAKKQDATRVQRLATRPGQKQYFRCKVCRADDNPLRPFSFVAIETDRRPLV